MKNHTSSDKPSEKNYIEEIEQKASDHFPLEIVFLTHENILPYSTRKIIQITE